jgi:voltage-gated potassium channel
MGVSVAFAMLVLVGAAGYRVLGQGQWTFEQGVYMTIITVFTVGYGELPGMEQVPAARVLTMVLICFGVVTMAYLQGSVTALLVEGLIGQSFRRQRMKRKVAALEGHIVVAGCGSTGRYVVEELVASRTPFVVIERSHEHMQRIIEDLAPAEVLYVLGDATDDRTLLEAGVARARGVVAALTHDKDNLFVTLSARSLNTTARITSKVTELETAGKMAKAGATTVVSPAMIGGHRMASDVIRPEVNEFLDAMLRGKERVMTFEELTVPPASSFVGKTIAAAAIRQQTRLLVVAVRDAQRNIVFNPDPDYVIGAGSTLIVMGPLEGVVSLRRLMREAGRAN